MLKLCFRFGSMTLVLNLSVEKTVRPHVTCDPVASVLDQHHTHTLKVKELISFRAFAFNQSAKVQLTVTNSIDQMSVVC